MPFEIKQLLNFKKNVGEKEQKIRYAIGSMALLISVFSHSVPLLLIGTILVATAKMNWCPICSGLGRNSYGN